MGADSRGNEQNRVGKSSSGGPTVKPGDFDSPSARLGLKSEDRGTDSLATAYGVWEKDGEITFISNLLLAKPCGLSSAKRNKKSGEIKPDG